MHVRAMVTDLVDEAGGRTHRDDAVAGRSGGPAGNARLTAWTGLLLLGLTLVELVTALDVQGLLTWHVVVGTLLVPVALVKTGSTMWRFTGYYARRRAYVQAGPPPMVLRVLGPLVVVSTLALLGTGIALIALGPDAGRRPFVTVLGQGIDVLTLHQATFIVFAGAAGLHFLARIVPALRLVAGRIARGVPGRSIRAAALTVTVLAGVVSAVVVARAETPWQHDHRHFGHRPGVVSHR